jgi:hypothetical protein
MDTGRLKKLEADLEDLKRWLELGLVPRKDIEKHKEEQRLLEEKIRVEQERLRQIKENEEFDMVPKKARRPGIEAHNTMEMAADLERTDCSLELEEEEEYSTLNDQDTLPSEIEDEIRHEVDEEDDDDDPFSDRNRWRRGILQNPDLTDWDY